MQRVVRGHECNGNRRRLLDREARRSAHDEVGGNRDKARKSTRRDGDHLIAWTVDLDAVPDFLDHAAARVARFSVRLIDCVLLANAR